MLIAQLINGELMKENGKAETFGGNDTIIMNTSSAIEKERQQKEDKKLAAKAFNEAVTKQEKAIREQTDREIAEGKRMQEKANSMEIVPCNSYVLVRPYARNPFERLDVTESGIVLAAPGTEKYVNPNTGEKEEMVNFSVQADVIEVGPLCKFVKPGDIVYYRRACGVPIPFFRQGFEVVAENQIHVIINEGIKKRFEKLEK